MENDQRGRTLSLRLTNWGPWLALALPPLLWAGNFIVGRAFRTDLPPATLAFVRHFVALICLLPFAFSPMRRQASAYWRVRWKVIGTAVTGMAGFNLLVYLGLHSTTASNALLLNSMIPVLISVVGAIFYRQALAHTQKAGLIISCVGVLVIILHGEPQRLVSLQFSGGDLTVFLGMVCFSFYSLWLRKLPKDLDPVGLLGWQLIVAALVLFPGFGWEYATGHHVRLTQGALLGIGYVAIATSLVATFVYMAGVARIGPARAGLFIHLIPVYGAILSTLFLGETIHLYHLVGMAVIVAGLAFSNARARGKLVAT